MMDDLEAHFDRLWPMLAEAVARYGPTHERHHVWDRIASGHAQLWPAPSAAVVTEIDTYPTGFRELNFWLAAGDMKQILVMQPHIERWAKDQGCDRIAIRGRRGWLRAADGFREALVAMVKEIG